jgi:multidrug resistance efflux pump
MESEERERLIELYSEEVQEILGKPPRWILSWGITLLFSVVILLFIGSWLFKYPDIIVSGITVTTENVPANLVAKSSGKITGLFAKDNEEVKKGQIIAVIENPAITEDVLAIKEVINEFVSENWLDGSFLGKISKQSFTLGEIEPAFSLFRSKLEEYIKYSARDYSEKKITAIESQLVNYRKLIAQMKIQVSLQMEDLAITRGQYVRDSLLYIQKVLSSAEFETSKMNLLRKTFTVETAKTTLTNSQIQYSQLDEQVMELRQERYAQNEIYELTLRQMLSNLKASIAQWQQNYVLITPVEGNLTFSRIWSIHQNVTAGELVVTVVPADQGKVIGILKLPVAGSGKVKKNQRVNVKFVNYPHMEFGMVIGRIEKISLVPDENNYLAEVAFPEGLVSNYGKKLPLLPEMTGSAEIITEDMRLIQRFFNPVKSLLRKNRQP